MKKLHFKNRHLWASCLAALLLFPAAVLSQVESAAAEKQANVDLIALKIAEIEASTTLDEETANTLVGLYRRTLTNLERARAEQSSAEAFASTAAAAPEELQRIRHAVGAQAGSVSAEDSAVDEEAPLPNLEQSLAEEKNRLAEAEALLSSLRESYAVEVARPGQARERLAQAHDELNATSAELSVPAPIGEATEITEARRWHLDSRTYRLNAEIHKLDQELLSNAVRVALLEARQEQSVLETERARVRVRLLDNAISQRRTAEAQLARQAAKDTQQTLEDRPEVMRELAIANVALSDLLTQRSMELQSASAQRDQLQQRVADIEDNFNSVKSKLAVAGLNQALGRLLIEQRRSLPHAHILKQQAAERDRRGAEVGLRQIQLTEQRRGLRNMDRYLDELTAGLPSEDAPVLLPELQSLAESQRELVDQTIEAGASYLRVLGELELVHRKLMNAVDGYRAYLDSALLWVRSTAPIGISVLASIPGDIVRLADLDGWVQAARDLGNALRTMPPMAALLILLIGIGLMRPRFLERLETSARFVGRIRLDRFRYSIEAFIYTLLAATPIPLALVTAGAAISGFDASALFTSALAVSLVKLGTDLLIIRFFLDACRDKGLALSHCRWSEFTVNKLRAELNWFIMVFPLIRFVGEFSYEQSAGEGVGGLAVLCLVASAIALAVLVFRLLTPAGGILRDYLEQHSNQLLAQLRPLWFGVAVAVVPLLVLLWLAGYHYTGDAIAVSFMHSFWLLLWLMLMQSLLARWLQLSYQRLEFEAGVERAKAARIVAAKASDTPGSAEDADLDVDEPEVDYAELSSDSRSLLKTAVLFLAVFWLWLIWSPIIPALGILDETALWSRTGLVSGETVQVPVTLMDLLLAVVVGIATGAAAKGLPSLVELILLRRTEMSEGGRYTIVKLLRYSIIAIGTIVVFGMIGISWSKLQWLVAALGVGIGFGLQEIVANFISGLIILFERPIRIGDIVTVGDTSGVVTRIRIRATTIRDWERRELLVPNKEFITKSVLNWTLSDTLTRVVIPFGVHYSADIVQAMKLAEEAARENEFVLEDPPPFVTFDGFGDSTLNITLRLYLPSLDNRLGVGSEIRETIKRKFEQADIVIAFPQRDIHLDTSSPLEIRMQPLKEPIPGTAA